MNDRRPEVFPRPGEPLDLRSILDRFGAPAMALAMNVLGNRQDAEDACQEAFLQVFRHLERYDGRAGFQTWLFTILYRRCLDMVRKRKRARRLYEKAQREEARRIEASRRGLPRGLPLSAKVLGALSPKERTALSLWANEGYTAEEISRVIQTSASTARVYLFQARRKLKTILEKEHEALQVS
jgi:RNA polymerase sigma-70 factor (ECF subfamily)